MIFESKTMNMMGKYHGDDQIEFKDSRFHELKTAKHELVLNSIRSRSVYLISDFWGRNSKWTEIFFIYLYKMLEKTPTIQPGRGGSNDLSKLLTSSTHTALLRLSSSTIKIRLGQLIKTIQFR